VIARRTLLRALGAGGWIVSTWPAMGQKPSKLPRVGVLWFAASADVVPGPSNARFRQRLSELGYVDGKTIAIDIRYAERDMRRLERLAAQLRSLARRAKVLRQRETVGRDRSAAGGR